MDLKRSTWSSPLRNGITKPFPTDVSGTRSSASRSCVDLTVTKHASTGSAMRVAVGTETLKSPKRLLSTRMPCSAIVRAVCSPAITSTELPARASSAASRPPTPPGPSTAKLEDAGAIEPIIFRDSWSQRWGECDQQRAESGGDGRRRQLGPVTPVQHGEQRGGDGGDLQ